MPGQKWFRSDDRVSSALGDESGHSSASSHGELPVQLDVVRKIGEKININTGTYFEI